MDVCVRTCGRRHIHSVIVTVVDYCSTSLGWAAGRQTQAAGTTHGSVDYPSCFIVAVASPSSSSSYLFLCWRLPTRVPKNTDAAQIGPLALWCGVCVGVCATLRLPVHPLRSCTYLPTHLYGVDSGLRIYSFHCDCRRGQLASAGWSGPLPYANVCSFSSIATTKHPKRFARPGQAGHFSYPTRYTFSPLLDSWLDK